MLFYVHLHNLPSNAYLKLTLRTKTGIDAAKIVDKITSIGKPKEKERTKEIEEIYFPPEKRQQIIDDLRLF